ncbi:hypothetical protein [Paenibacillus sp. DYY-L-2]|uniref:hypothetical protein n=1 Tax=Paenibacillus sp. DYY-L-2 TaxID=3447013 RepID=UPI003F4F59DF
MKQHVFFCMSVLGLFILWGCSPAENQRMNETEQHASPVLQERSPLMESLDPANSGNEELAEYIAGEAEDENLKVSIKGALNEEESGYLTTMRFQNKTTTSIDLIYDCGMLLTNSEVKGSDRICASVESMLLEGEGSEEMEMIIDSDWIRNEAEIFVRYRKDNHMKKLYVQLSN